MRSLPLALAAALLATTALAQTRTSTPIGSFGQTSRQPINIEADSLRVVQSADQAIYSGNVVAVQGDTTMKCTRLTVFFENRGGAGLLKPGDGQATASAIRRLECAGPMSVVSKDQVATAANAVYDRVAGLVTLTGDVALSQGGNVTRGERMVYDVNSGVARVEGGRVRGLFVPGSGSR
jgi:lipopolysaccharide export system protein LptA